MDAACQIIVACDVTDAPNDKQQAEPMTQATRATLAQAGIALPQAEAGRQPLGIKDMGQRAIPDAVPPHRDHAHGRAAWVRTRLAHLDDLIPRVWAAAQRLPRAIGSLCPHARDKEAVRGREVIEPQKAEKSQVNHQQPAESIRSF